MKKVSVLIVEDSPSMRLLLEAIVNADARLDLMGSCASGEDAIRFVARARPDVISMDILLPGIDGLEATRRILETNPIPVVVISSTTSGTESRSAMEALHAGALAVLPKPEGPMAPDFARRSRKITDALVAMSQVRVIRRTRPGRAMSSRPLVPSDVPNDISHDVPVGVIGIAASTGGPVALVDLLRPLPANFPIPILLVQHITPGFGESFASWLNETVSLEVAAAQDDERLVGGRVIVARDGWHLAVKSGRTRLLDTPPVGVHRPSANVLFDSLAKEFGANAAGIVLTGMGRDGADGLLTMRRAGAWTAAQDEAGCAVFGMPEAARAIGATRALLPLGDLATILGGFGLQQPCPQ